VEQAIHFCTTTDGVRIAYATVGQGRPLVKAANWLNHLEYDWRSPIWRPFLDEFARDHLFVRYDERGNGLSDWDVADLSFESFVSDLESVVDAVGLNRFPILGISQGGPVAIAYAVRHPERVSQLILYGSYAQGWAKRPGQNPEIRQAQLTLIKLGWGQDNPAFRQMWTSLYLPDGTAEQWQWFNDMQRISASPENAFKLTNELGQIDVTDLLPQVKVPTLVIHRRGDAAVPFEQGRLLASSIPGARFVELEGNSHLVLPTEATWPRFVTEMRHFLGADLQPLNVKPTDSSSSVAQEIRHLSAGKSLGRYTITSLLGQGGMGKVYLAQDTKLDRKVALKVLPPDVAADRSRMNRFVQEAKAASALNHPNIITIYEIDETDSGHFIATEFIDGETVRECLRKASFTVSEALTLAVQVAAALAAAHQAGIIHRDIKPENVMVRADGLVKVLDFGLAKLITTAASDPDAATLIQSDTLPGMVMGTVAYMSPEQARGKAVDARTDVWSLGVLLYEMLSRRPPFSGETASDTLANILHREPDALNIGALPADLVTIVERMLTKKLEARYQTVANVLSDLKSLQRRLEFDSELQQTVLRSAEVHTEVIAAATASKSVNETAADSASSRHDEGFWVAVLPFKYPGSNPDLEALGEGLSEDIVTGLSRFPHLRVIARSSTSRFAGAAGDVRSIGKELGARYVIEGSLRHAGKALRATVQLLDAMTGAHMWAETYNRDLSQSDIFTVQDDLTDRVVATVADSYGVLVRSMAASVEEKPETELTASDWVLRQYRYRQLLTPEEHAKVRDGLERFVEREPKHAAPWACLAQLYVDEYVFKFNPRLDALDRALEAARRSVDLDRSYQYGNQILAQVHFFRRDTAAFRTTAEQAMSLNSRDTDTLAMMGLMLVHIAEFERGANIVRRAMDLNPNHAGWFHFALIWEYLNKGDYEKALGQITRVNMPGLFWQPLTVASICGLLERPVEAASAVNELRKLDPDFELHVREYIEVWHYSSGLMDRILEGLGKAGVEIASDALTPSFTSSAIGSSERPAQEGFWVAVLPFKYRGVNAELEGLAEGISEDIVTGLSRFSYLRVIARSSTQRFNSEATDVRSVGKELGARYVMEGSLRQVGSMLRLAVQLVDASTGAHLWAETYARSFSPEAVFELQDDLVPRIVSTVADWYGVLPRSMSEVLREKPIEQLSPYEAVLRSFGYSERRTPEEHAIARAGLEQAVQQAPRYADAWALLSFIQSEEYATGFNAQADPLGRALHSAQCAADAAPSNALAYFVLARVQFFRKEFNAFRTAAERAITLNPMDGGTIAFMGVYTAYSTDWERGCEMIERAMNLNPRHPGSYWFPLFYNAYRKRDYPAALSIALKINLPHFFYNHVVLAAVYGQLGNQEAADDAVRELLLLRSDFAVNARAELGKWYPPELVEHLIDGLRKAGLEIADHDALRTSSTRTESDTTAESSPSIAVLPFANLSNDPDNEYFCEGLAEELLNALSKIDDLKVAARTSAFSFKGKNVNVSEIGDSLNVKNVLEGSVRKSGNKLRITAQLVNASDGYHLWSERYDREMRDIFDVQDEITLAVVDALKLKLFGGEKAAVLKRYTDDAEVHELFLKGRYYYYKYSAEGWKHAIEFFERALQKQSDYAPAYAGIAASFGCLAFFGMLPAAQAFPQCKEATIKALQLDDKLAEAYLSQALATFIYDWEWEKAEQEFKQSIALSPNNAEALSYYALFLGFEERFEEAINCAKRSLEIDPLSPLINMNVGWVYFSAGLLAEVTNQVKRMIEIEPGFYGAYWLKGALHLSEGEYEKAIEELTRAVTLGGRQMVLADLGSAHGLAQGKDEAKKILDQLLEMRQRDYVPAICLARVYSRLGESEKTIEWLEKAFEERNGEMVFLKGEISGAADDDPLSSLGSHPKVIELLGKMNLPNN
jgi:TolB-like protein/pimeloyl-ACP methyl ester carboxylesterase/Tfp pilus assembly protein PilF